MLANNKRSLLGSALNSLLLLAGEHAYSTCSKLQLVELGAWKQRGCGLRRGSRRCVGSQGRRPVQHQQSPWVVPLAVILEPMFTDTDYGALGDDYG
jgi:hypothetical protein